VNQVHLVIIKIEFKKTKNGDFKMKKNLFVILLATFTAGSMMAESDREPVLAETVEMPGNVVGSLFGGGYAKRSHDNKEKRKRDAKQSKKEKEQDSKRRRARRRAADERDEF
jgi:hypothetical protein